MPDCARIEMECAGAVARLRLARPETGNRIDAQMIDELNRALTRLADDPATSFLVVQGSEGTFCSGMEGMNVDGGQPPDVQTFSRWERVVETLEQVPQVTVAVIEGACCGAGLDLALACDCRVATTDAFVQLPEIELGLLPSMVLFRLPKYVGMAAAKRLVLTGRRWTAVEAHAAGLLDFVVAPDELDARLEQVLDEYRPVCGTAVTMARRLLAESYATANEDALGNFLAAQARCLWKAAEQPV
jgi:enoyl-CoA hydratase/carnithine racemase